MIAYNKDWLYNLFVCQQTDDAFDAGLVSATEKTAIYEQFKTGFYTPNLFVRIGLFVLTIVIVTFTIGLVSLMFLNAIEHSFELIFFFFGLMAYAALEIMVNRKNHYQSGVDDALLWSSASLFVGGIVFSTEASPFASCLLACMVAIYCSLRFADRLMAVAGFISFMGVLFFGGNELGNMAKSLMPFLLMAVSALVYLIANNNKTEAFNVYSGCFTILEIISLLAFYCFGNYWVIENLSERMQDSVENQPIHLGWLFWVFTIAIPLFYLLRGVQKKDIVLLRVGLLLVAAMVFTIRYYHSIAPLEIAMTVGGVILIAIGWALTRYLQTPKFGFTYQELGKKHALDALKIESLVIAETFGHSTSNSAGNDVQFGGGTGGGGGASGDY